MKRAPCPQVVFKLVVVYHESIKRKLKIKLTEIFIFCFWANSHVGHLNPKTTARVLLDYECMTSKGTLFVNITTIEGEC